MLESFLRWIFIGASALAAGLGGYVILSAVVNFAEWVYRRRRPSWVRQLEKQRRALPTLAVRQNHLSRIVVLVIALGLSLKAAVTGGILVAVFLSAVGIALYVYLGSRTTSLAREQATDAVGELIAAYYSAYLVIPTVFGALAEANRTQTNLFLQSAVQRALDAFGTGKTTEEVLEQLDGEVQNPYLTQFTFILRHTSESNQKEILSALRELSNRLDQRKRLKDRSRVALALVSGTVRFLQAANGAVMALAVLVPFWWNFYSSSISHQALLMIGGAIALLGSWYFENQLTQLRERVL
jgi:hypothetical protein